MAVTEGRGLSLQVGQRVMINRRILLVRSREFRGGADPPCVRYIADDEEHEFVLIARAQRIGVLQQGSPVQWFDEDAIQVCGNFGG